MFGLSGRGIRVRRCILIRIMTLTSLLRIRMFPKGLSCMRGGEGIDLCELSSQSVSEPPLGYKANDLSLPPFHDL
jgi:hypothetical protein